MAASDHLSRGQHPQLFPTSHLEAQRDYSPEKWLQTATYHSSFRDTMPQEGDLDEDDQNAFGTGFHHGTLHSAVFAGRAEGPREWVHPLQMRGPVALAGESGQTANFPSSVPSRNVFNDDQANSQEYLGHPYPPQTDATDLMETGHNIPYASGLEDAGSVAYRSPRSNLKTWREDVMSDPNAPSRYRAQAEHGVDLAINMGKEPQHWHQLTTSSQLEYEHTGMMHGPQHPDDFEVERRPPRFQGPMETHGHAGAGVSLGGIPQVNDYWDERGVVSKPQFKMTRPGNTT